MSNLPITQIPANPANFAVGRGSCSPLAIYLHQTTLTVTQLDASSCRKKRAGSADASFHFGVDGSVVHQYVNINDTAFTFGTIPASPAVPGKPPTCTDDQSTINIALSTPPIYADINMDNCPTSIVYTSLMQETLAKLLCNLSKETGLPLDAVTVLLNTTELPDFPLADVLALANACLNAPPYFPPPCECGANACVVPPAVATDTLTGFVVAVNTEAGVCATRILSLGDPVAACTEAPEAVALTPTGWKPVRQSWRVVETTGGAFSPDDYDMVVVTAPATIVINNPTCNTANIEVKNATTGVVNIIFNAMNLNGGAAGIVLNGTNALATGDGESVELLFVNGKYYAH